MSLPPGTFDMTFRFIEAEDISCHSPELPLPSRNGTAHLFLNFPVSGCRPSTLRSHAAVNRPIWETVECVVTRISSLTLLMPSGIYQSSRRKSRTPGRPVNVCGKDKILQQRLGKPAHRRPEIRIMGNAGFIPPSSIDYAILFDGTFSGLAYGLEDLPD